MAVSPAAGGRKSSGAQPMTRARCLRMLQPAQEAFALRLCHAQNANGRPHLTSSHGKASCNRRNIHHLLHSLGASLCPLPLLRLLARFYPTSLPSPIRHQFGAAAAALTIAAQVSGAAAFKVAPRLGSARAVRAVKLAHRRVGKVAWLGALAAFELGLMSQAAASKARDKRRAKMGRMQEEGASFP